MKLLLLMLVPFSILSCTQTMNVLDGADFACGRIHVEGYFTDTEGEVAIGKVPDDWTPEQFVAVCPVESQ